METIAAISKTLQENATTYLERINLKRQRELPFRDLVLAKLTNAQKELAFDKCRIDLYNPHDKVFTEFKHYCMIQSSPFHNVINQVNSDLFKLEQLGVEKFMVVHIVTDFLNAYEHEQLSTESHSLYRTYIGMNHVEDKSKLEKWGLMRKRKIQLERRMLMEDPTYFQSSPVIVSESGTQVQFHCLIESNVY